MSNEILYNIARIVIAVVAALVSAYLIPWLKAKTKSMLDEKLYTIVETAVQAAEQNPGIISGTDKKDYAKEFIKDLCGKANITVSDAEIDGLIESAVFGVNLVSKSE